MKKMIAFALSAVLALGMAGCSSSSGTSTPSGTNQSAAPAPQGGGQTSLVFTLPTGSMGGSYYSSGTAMAQIFNTYVEGMEMSVSASNSQDNVGMLESGEVDFAMASGSDYVSVMEDEPQNSPNICSMGVFNQNVSMIVVKGDSSYQTLSDLQGKKIQMGSSGSGQYLLNKAIIETLGLTTDDFSAEYMSQSDGTQAFIEGKVEGNMIASGVPSSLLTQISASDPDFRILTWDEDYLAKFLDNYSYYKVCTVDPADLGCKSITEPVKMPAFYGELLVRADVDEEVVYNMCKALYEHQDELVAAYAGCAFCTPEHAVEFSSYNLHPGAQRYFQEIGVL